MNTLRDTSTQDSVPPSSQAGNRTGKPAEASTTMNVPSFLQLIGVAELGNMVTSHLSIADWGSLRGTCSQLRSLRPDINARLKDFVSNPNELRNIQAATDALISGTFALSFVEGRDAPISTPEIFCPFRYTTLWRAFLASENYTEVPKAASNRKQWRKEFRGTEFRRPGGPDSTEYMTIILQDNSGSPFWQFLYTPKPSPLMNVITWNKIYVLLPKDSFQHRRMYGYLTGQNRKITRPAVTKLIREIDSHGWHVGNLLTAQDSYTFRDEESLEETRGRWPSLKRVRRVGDRSSCIMPLSIAGIRSCPAFDYIELYEYRFLLEKSETHWFAESFEFEHPLLKYDYLATKGYNIPEKKATLDGTEGSILQTIRKVHLDPLLRWEVNRHKSVRWKGGRSAFPNGAAEANTFGRDVALTKVPKNWRFVDEQMHGWYARYEEVRKENRERGFKNNSARRAALDLELFLCGQ